MVEYSTRSTMAQSPLFEISRCKIPITKGDIPSISWENSVLTVKTEKNISLFKLSHNLQCIDKKINWIITDIPCPKTSPAASVFSKKFLNQNIQNIEYTEMMLDPVLWPHSTQLMEEMTSTVSFKWSPPNFIHNNESAIAILNTIGNIELFGPTSCGYSSVFNLSSVIESKYGDNFEEKVPANMEEAKLAAKVLQTSAFCWGSVCNNKFNLVTAQKDSSIHFWQLVNVDNIVQAQELIMHRFDAGEIVTMQWIPISENIFILLLANMLGQLSIYKYQWEDGCPKLINCDNLWPYQDRMTIKHIEYKIVADKIIIICNKHRHLLVLLIDHSCNKLSEYLNNLNDYKITVITKSNNDIYVGMINCKIFKVNISINNVNNSLNVSVEEIIIKDNIANHDLCALQFSRNNVLCALGIVNRKLLYRKENVSLDIIFLTQNEGHQKEMAILLDNPTKKLTDYWDCVEIVRCKTMKLKILPFIDFNRLYSSNNLYELKLYYLLLVFYSSLESILKNKSKGWLPETSQETVKDRILSLQANITMKRLLKKQETETLNDIQCKQLIGVKKYLKFYCEKYNVSPLEFCPSAVLDVEKEDFEYTCQCCDEMLKGFSCPKRHLNMFCSLTFTLIETEDYICCPACYLLARKELLSEHPMCVYCDLYLNSYFLPS